ncbi:MAG: (2Fe-2S)-binding protein [Siculibacillus sp.]
MILCSCNVLSERVIRDTLTPRSECLARVSEVFGSLGCRPQCGRCAPSIRRLIREAGPQDRDRCPAVIDDLGPIPPVLFDWGSVLVAAE